MRHYAAVLVSTNVRNPYFSAWSHCNLMTAFPTSSGQHAEPGGTRIGTRKSIPMGVVVCSSSVYNAMSIALIQHKNHMSNIRLTDAPHVSSCMYMCYNVVIDNNAFINRYLTFWQHSGKQVDCTQIACLQIIAMAHWQYQM